MSLKIKMPKNLKPLEEQLKELVEPPEQASDENARQYLNEEINVSRKEIKRKNLHYKIGLVLVGATLISVPLMYKHIKELENTKTDSEKACIDDFANDIVKFWENNRGIQEVPAGDWVEKKIEEAIIRYTKEIGENPTNSTAYLNLGCALYDKGYFEYAIKEYRTAIELNPTDVTAIINLGVALNVRGDRNEAIVQYEKALKIDPENIGAHVNLAIALQNKEDLNEQQREVKESYKHMLMIMPTNMPGFIYRNESYKKMIEHQSRGSQYL